MESKNTPLEKVQDEIKRIEQLLTNAKLRQAIDHLQALKDAVPDDHGEEINIIGTNFDELSDEEKSATISPENLTLRRNQISLSILNLLEQIKQDLGLTEDQKSSSIVFSTFQVNYFNKMIQQGEVKETLYLILGLENELSSSALKPFRLLARRLNDLNRDTNKGILSQEYRERNRNQISSDLLGQIETHHNEKAQNPFGLDQILKAREDTSNRDVIKRIEEAKANGERSLDLSDFGLERIPKRIAELPELEELILSHNKIRNIEYLDSLTKLERLFLNSNHISLITGLDKLTKLKFLSLGNNTIHSIENLESLSQLVSLDLSNNQIRQIENLHDLVNLQVLVLVNNEIGKLENLDSLLQLEHLLLGANQIQKIEGLTNLMHLQTLELSGNPLQILENLQSLTNLKRLFLVDCGIKEIRISNGLEQLTTLFLSNNALTSQSLNYLTSLINLRDLRLGGNKINQIAGIEKLANLQRLELNNNQIAPASVVGNNTFFDFLFAKAERLVLRIHNNPFLSEIPGLNQLDYQSNKKVNHIRVFLSDYEHVFKKGSKKVKIKLPHKIVLLGNSNSGKTSLVDFLCDGVLQGDAGKESTEILEIKKWEPISEKEFLIYDFGGQDFYHGTYQLFLSQEATYLALWSKDNNYNHINTDRTDFRPDDYLCFNVNYWLGNIRYFNEIVGDHSRSDTNPGDSDWMKNLLLVENKIDLKPANNQVHEIDPIFAEAERFKISLNKERNTVYSRRRLWLKDYLKLQHPGATAEIETRAKAIDNYLDTWEELRVNNRWKVSDLKQHLTNRFKSWQDLDVVDVERILQRFNTSGLLLWYPFDAALKDYVWIDPKKLQVEVLEFLKSVKEIAHEEGKFEMTGLEEITVQDGQTTKILLDLLLKQQVLFQDGNTYIIPQKLPLSPEKDPIFRIATQGLPPAFTIRFQRFMPLGIMNRLIAIFGNDSEDQFYSRYQLIFSLRDVETKEAKKIYLKCDMQELSIEIRTHSKSKSLWRNIFFRILLSYHRIEFEVRGQITSKQNSNSEEERDFAVETMVFEALSESTKRILEDTNVVKIDLDSELTPSERPHHTLEQLVPEDLQVALNDRYFIDYHDLLKAQENNLHIVTPHLDKDETQTKNVKSYQFNAFMDEGFNRPKKVFISYSHDDVEYRQELQKYLITLKRDNLIEIWQDEMIQVGSDWDETIRQNLQTADIVILLISQSFIASDYIYQVELQEALKMSHDGKTIFPILIENCDYQNFSARSIGKITNVAQLQFIPHNNGRLLPISDWDNPSKAWVQVTKALREKIES